MWAAECMAERSLLLPPKSELHSPLSMPLSSHAWAKMLVQGCAPLVGRALPKPLLQLILGRVREALAQESAYAGLIQQVEPHFIGPPIQPGLQRRISPCLPPSLPPVNVNDMAIVNVSLFHGLIRFTGADTHCQHVNLEKGEGEREREIFQVQCKTAAVWGKHPVARKAHTSFSVTDLYRIFSLLRVQNIATPLIAQTSAHLSLNLYSECCNNAMQFSLQICLSSEGYSD